MPLVLFALMLGCDNRPIGISYRPILPEIPKHWSEILGEPYWQLEWIGSGGTWQEWEGAPGRAPPYISLMEEWSSPVLAWPFWPSWGLLPGMMRPAGALFPWDTCAGNLTLSWEGGVLALFWKELALAKRPSAPTTATEARRQPWYFDWPRFRELLASENIPQAVREDLWLADWQSIAARTVQSGFDRRRIVARQFTELAIPGAGGRWIGSSPFAAPLDAQAADTLVVKVTNTPDTWVSSSGVLRASVSGWVPQGNLVIQAAHLDPHLIYCNYSPRASF